MKILITLTETVKKSIDVDIDFPDEVFGVDRAGKPFLDYDLVNKIVQEKIELGEIVLGEDSVDDVERKSISINFVDG